MRSKNNFLAGLKVLENHTIKSRGIGVGMNFGGGFDFYGTMGINGTQIRIQKQPEHTGKISYDHIAQSMERQANYESPINVEIVESGAWKYWDAVTDEAAITTDVMNAIYTDAETLVKTTHISKVLKFTKPAGPILDGVNFLYDVALYKNNKISGNQLVWRGGVTATSLAIGFSVTGHPGAVMAVGISVGGVFVEYATIFSIEVYNGLYNQYYNSRSRFGSNYWEYMTTGYPNY